MKKIISYFLIVIAVLMFYLSYQIKGLPPALTGVGFILIAIVFLTEKNQ